jgi:hypothetical protein
MVVDTQNEATDNGPDNNAQTFTYEVGSPRLAETRALNGCVTASL